MKRIKGLNLHSHTYGNNYIIKQRHLISRFLKVKRKKKKKASTKNDALNDVSANHLTYCVAL